MPKRGYKQTKEHKENRSLANKGQVRSEKTKENLSLAHKGQIPWNKNKEGVYSEEALNKMRQFRLGKAPWNKNKKGYTTSWKGQYHTKKTREKQSEVKRGEKSWNWKGGISELGARIRRSFQYRQWRSDVFTRDDFTCQKCGRRGGKLNAHHNKKSFALIMELNDIKTLEQAMECSELWDINNGETLCEKCHSKAKKGSEVL